MKVGYLGPPSPYGLFTVYRHLRSGLQPHGIELRWLANRRWTTHVWTDPEWECERSTGEAVGNDNDSLDEMGKAMARHLVQQGYQAVFINPPQDHHLLNLPRFLPPSLLRIMIVHSMARGVFRVCRGVKDYVHCTVGVSPRVRQDLVEHFGFDPARTIANTAGIDLSPYHALVRAPSTPRLRIIHFGRIVKGKGVFMLPTLLQRLRDEDVELHIAGNGPDLEELRKRSQPLGQRIRFLGVVPPNQIPNLLMGYDVLVFPSYSEGLPYALLESIAAGCVPVSSRIRGCTDFVVRDGETGFLFPVGDATAATTAVRRLARDRQLLQRLSAAAIEDCRRRFDAVLVGNSWSELLQRLRHNPPPIADPLPLEQWNYPKEFRPGWRGLIPKSIKNLVRPRSA